MNKIPEILAAFAVALTPQSPVPVTEWAAQNVTLTRSSRSTQADLAQTPWLVAPLEAAIGNDYSDICLVAPVGSGKTTLLEILSCYIVAEKPGPTLILCQTDNDASEWNEVGLRPALKACKPIDNLWPANRHAIKKELYLFPHMPLWICGANISNTQAKSVDFAIGDEVVFWQKPQLIGELAKRRHDRPFAKMILVSQPLLINDPFAQQVKTCQTMEFQFICPDCGTRQPFDFSKLKFEPVTHYACDCGHHFDNDPITRRSMAASASYIPLPCPTALPGRIAYTWNALTVWWIDWDTLKNEFQLATAESKKGNLAPLQQFLNKRLAQPWDDEQAAEAPAPIILGSYSLGDDIERHPHTFLTVDVQSHDASGLYFYFTVRTWDGAGGSKLLDYGTFASLAEIPAKQAAFGILPYHVAIDNAYKTDEINEFAATHGFLCLNGGKESFYTVTDRATGKTYKRIFSNLKRERTTSGKTAKCYLFSSQRMKATFANIKKSPSWEIPCDVSETYQQHIQAYRYETKKGVGTWTHGSRRADLADCEIMQITLAIIYKVFAASIDNPPSDI